MWFSDKEIFLSEKYHLRFYIACTLTSENAWNEELRLQFNKKSELSAKIQALNRNLSAKGVPRVRTGQQSDVNLEARLGEIQHLNTEQVVMRWSGMGIQVSARTLEDWRRLGKGPAYITIARRVYYPLDFLQEYEEDCARIPKG